jgi:hypothetical protein
MSMDADEGAAPEPAPVADPPLAPPGGGPGPGPELRLWIAAFRSRAGAPVATIATGETLVEPVDISSVSSQRPTEPVPTIDAPNAASSRLTCRACLRAELLNDSSVVGV